MSASAEAEWSAAIAHCSEEQPRIAFIIEADCIGCTKCLQVCPVDAIVGANGMLHGVVARWCMGCDLCAPVCPTDCIAMVERPQGMLAPRPALSRARFERRRERLQAADAVGSELVALASFDKAELQSAVRDAVARHRHRRRDRA